MINMKKLTILLIVIPLFYTVGILAGEKECKRKLKGICVKYKNQDDDDNKQVTTEKADANSESVLVDIDKSRNKEKGNLQNLLKDFNDPKDSGIMRCEGDNVPFEPRFLAFTPIVHTTNRVNNCPLPNYSFLDKDGNIDDGMNNFCNCSLGNEDNKDLSIFKRKLDEFYNKRGKEEGIKKIKEVIRLSVEKKAKTVKYNLDNYKKKLAIIGKHKENKFTNIFSLCRGRASYLEDLNTLMVNYKCSEEETAFIREYSVLGKDYVNSINVKEQDKISSDKSLEKYCDEYHKNIHKYCSRGEIDPLDMLLSFANIKLDKGEQKEEEQEYEKIISGLACFKHRVKNVISEQNCNDIKKTYLPFSEDKSIADFLGLTDIINCESISKINKKSEYNNKLATVNKVKIRNDYDDFFNLGGFAGSARGLPSDTSLDEIGILQAQKDAKVAVDSFKDIESSLDKPKSAEVKIAPSNNYAVKSPTSRTKNINNFLNTKRYNDNIIPPNNTNVAYASYIGNESVNSANLSQRDYYDSFDSNPSDNRNDIGRRISSIYNDLKSGSFDKDENYENMTDEEYFEKMLKKFESNSKLMKESAENEADERKKRAKLAQAEKGKRLFEFLKKKQEEIRKIEKIKEQLISSDKQNITPQANLSGAQKRANSISSVNVPAVTPRSSVLSNLGLGGGTASSSSNTSTTSLSEENYKDLSAADAFSLTVGDSIKVVDTEEFNSLSANYNVVSSDTDLAIYFNKNNISQVLVDMGDGTYSIYKRIKNKDGTVEIDIDKVVKIKNKREDSNKVRKDREIAKSNKPKEIKPKSRDLFRVQQLNDAIDSSK